jgi:ATP-dependent Clp protease protease subunit
MLYVKRKVQELIARHSGRTVAEVEADSDRDRWFSAEQAVAYGLIDEVISEAAAVAA